MGILVQSAKIILQEHAFRPINGRILLCARQTVHLDDQAARELMVKAGVKQDPAWRPEFDPVTRAAKADGKKFLSDRSFFAAFTQATVDAIDVSPYEGADIIHDMCHPVPEEHWGRYDFIYNGSCMDNVFDPGQYIINTSKLLKPGGRIVHIEHGSLWPGAYLTFSPEWFFNYYASNGFVDCKVYAGVFPLTDDGSVNATVMDLFQWAPFFTRDPAYSRMKAVTDTAGGLMIFTVAEKSQDPAALVDVKPVQAHYRSEVLSKRILDTHGRFQSSPRPILETGLKTQGNLPLNQDHYTYVGSGF